MGLLEGKVAIVTGGGQGIGRGICLAMAKEGATIAVVDINDKTCKDILKEAQAKPDWLGTKPMDRMIVHSVDLGFLPGCWELHRISPHMPWYYPQK